MAFGEAPRGIQDGAAFPVTGASNTVGDGVDIPGFRSLNFNTSADSDKLEGDNKILAVARNAPELTGSLEVALINLASQAVMIGGTVGTTGTTPNIVTSLSQSDSISYVTFQLEIDCPSLDATGSGYHVILNKLTATSGPDESHTINDWTNPTIDFEGSGIGGVLLVRKQYETNVAIILEP